MLIASRIKRPLAPIDFGDRVYFFTPVDPRDPGSTHVCEITDNAHIGRLLGITECYYLPDNSELPGAPLASKPIATTPAAKPLAAVAADQLAASAMSAVNLTASVASGADGATTENTATATGIVLDELPEEQAEAAKNLSELSWQKLKAVLKEGGIAGAVIHEALRLETAKPEEDQRSTNIKVLSQALETL